MAAPRPTALAWTFSTASTTTSTGEEAKTSWKLLAASDQISGQMFRNTRGPGASLTWSRFSASSVRTSSSGTARSRSNTTAGGTVTPSRRWNRASASYAWRRPVATSTIGSYCTPNRPARTTSSPSDRAARQGLRARASAAVLGSRTPAYNARRSHEFLRGPSFFVGWRSPARTTWKTGVERLVGPITQRAGRHGTTVTSA
jgi:hypothetical protein